MKNSNPKYKSHQEAANMGEVVKTREESNEEADGNIQEKKHEFLTGGIAL